MVLKLIIGLVVAIPTCWHIFATAVYLGPDNLLVAEFNEQVRSYMRPIFTQNWHLFSPNPGITSDVMEVRCKTGEGPWKAWVDPLKNLRDAHYRNRATGRAKLLYVYRQIGSRVSDQYSRTSRACMRKIRSKLKSRRAASTDITPEMLAEEKCTMKDLMAEVRNLPDYELASRFALDLCESASENSAADVHAQIRLAKVYPKKYTKRHEKGRWGDVFNLQFAPETRRRASSNVPVKQEPAVSGPESAVSNVEVPHDA